MARRARSADVRVGSAGIKTRFVLTMTAALTLVMAIAGMLLAGGVSQLVEGQRRDALANAAKLTSQSPSIAKSTQGMRHPTGVSVFEMTYEGMSGEVYEYTPPSAQRGDKPFRIIVPGGASEGRQKLVGMIVGILVVVVLVGAGVALWVADQVTRPIHQIIEDVQRISRGALDHRIRAVGVGEVELLARSIDRMTRDLKGAQETEVELSMRDRELDVAGEVRESLLPMTTPLVEGYDVGAAHLPSGGFSGDFHDFVEREDGRFGLLVCDVSGTGVPAALVGATARAYLRTELAHRGDVGEALCRINRQLAFDVRRGMFVTALYALIDPATGRATIASAGHKLPLVRFTAADGKLRAVHPDGIALAFDKGPVFERRLEIQELELAVGDRLVLATSRSVELVDPAGQELGEKGLYARLLRHAGGDTQVFLRGVRGEIQAFVGADGVDVDVSVVTVAREA